MNYSQQEILRVFYISGIIIFSVVALANSYTNFVTWDSMILSFKVSSVAMNIFNYVLAIFFYYLLKSNAKAFKNIDEDEAEEIFKEALK